MHLRKECGPISSVGYPAEHGNSELCFGFILKVGHDRNVALGVFVMPSEALAEIS